jgi:hypothetical protein
VIEDTLTRQHAQYAVAATLAVGARAVRLLMDRLPERPRLLDLHAPGLTASPETAWALQRAARSAVRSALGEPPLGVVPEEQPQGYRVRVALAPDRPALRAHEVSDLQVAWQRALMRELRRWEPLRPAQADIAPRQQALDEALAALKDLRSRAFGGDAGAREALGHAINQAEMASDALRQALRAATPLRHDRRIYSDTLTLVVRTEGARGLPLLTCDQVLRDTFARAAGMADPSELRVTTRPTRDPETFVARLSFNLRNAPERGPAHINPGSLRDTLVAGTSAVPATPVQVGAATVQVVVRSVVNSAMTTQAIAAALREERDVPAQHPRSDSLGTRER